MVDHVSSFPARLDISRTPHVEDNEAVIRMIIKGRTRPSRTHLVDLDKLFDESIWVNQFPFDMCVPRMKQQTL